MTTTTTKTDQGTEKASKHGAVLGMILFSFLGLALLYPYNAMISAVDWFAFIMPDVNSPAGLMSNANFIASMITTFLILIFASPKEQSGVHHENADGEHRSLVRRQSSRFETFNRNVKLTLLSLNFRIYTGFILEGAPLLLFALIYPNEQGAFWLAFIVGIGDAMAQSGIFPLAAGIGARCTAAASMGSALAGLLAGLLRLLTKAVFPEDDKGMRQSSATYFCIAASVIVLCALSLFYINRNKLEIQVAFLADEEEEVGDIKEDVVGEDVADTDPEANVNADANDEEENKKKQVDPSGINEEAVDPEANVNDDADDEEENEQKQIDPRGNEEAVSSSEKPKHRLCSVFLDTTAVYRDTLRCAWLPILMQFINFVITLSIFPGVVTSMTSESFGDWLPVILVTVFNAGDTAARLPLLNARVVDSITKPVGTKIIHPTTGTHLGNRCPKMKYSIAIPCILRVVFYPLLIFCVNPLYIDNDGARIAIVVLFAASSGWVFSSCFVMAPELCRSMQHKEAASLLLIIVTLVALGVGSSVGLVIADAVTA